MQFTIAHDYEGLLQETILLADYYEIFPNNLIAFCMDIKRSVLVVAYFERWYMVYLNNEIVELYGRN